MKILIMGADGFIGRNLAAHLAERPGFSVIAYDKDSTETDLRSGVEQADVICHLAGINRPEDVSEFTRGNVDLTRTLCEVVRAAGRSVPIIFASSIQAARANPYGASKLAAEQTLLRYADEGGGRLHIFRLPNVFGKWSRPNYNSVVATFCHNIARDLPIRIDDPETRLELVYIDDVVDAFAALMRGRAEAGPYCGVEPVYSVTLGEIAERLLGFRASRTSLLSDRVGTGLTRALYATYLSYLPPGDFSYELPTHGDARGIFVEMLQTKDSGQISFFTAPPGVSRGGHYHHTKTEKFLVVRGRARFRFRHILSAEAHEVATSGEKPEIVETVPGWAHDITNVGDDDMIVMLWANEIYDRDHPDTYASPL